MSRGLRNFNPGNIRKGGDTFQFERIPSQDKAFKQFLNIASGYRAMFKTLATYLKAHKCDTIETIIARWAPPKENDTKAYIKTVCAISGIDRDKELTLKDGELYIKIVAAMSEVENGIEAVLRDVEDGFKMQRSITIG